MAGKKTIFNINKKQNTLPTQLLYKNKTSDNNDDIAKSFNTFFTNIGNTVEEKFLLLRLILDNFYITGRLIEFFATCY